MDAAAVREPVLALEGARMLLEPGGGPSAPIDLALFPGDLALIEAADRAQSTLFCDALLGLASPVAGCVRFLGRDWTQVPHLHAQAMRGRIGQIFAAGAWIDGLGVADAVLLPQLYHTRRAEADLRDEAARLAATFGLPGLPLGRPADVSPADLQRAACVRAFLGRPKLILLQNPTWVLGAAVLEPLINAVRAARDRDAAVVWLSPDAAICADASVPADSRHRLRGGSLHPPSRAAA